MEKRIRQLLTKTYESQLIIFESRYSHGEVLVVGRHPLVTLLQDALIDGDTVWDTAYGIIGQPWFPAVTGADYPELMEKLEVKLQAMTRAQFIEVWGALDYLDFEKENVYEHFAYGIVPKLNSFRDFVTWLIPSRMDPEDWDSFENGYQKFELRQGNENG